jgi:sugar/nucleoside kinase (ribokinase family)
MTEKNCGAVTENIVNAIKEVAKAHPKLLIYADSRSKIRDFKEVIIKGNLNELKPEECPKLNLENKRPVILTKSERGAEIYDEGVVHKVEGINITGGVDVTGAGDMFTAAFVASYSLGMPIQKAGRLGVLASALSVMQVGTTGYVTADDLKDF